MTDFINKIICGDWVDVLGRIPNNFVHCCVTSPPYWGQRLYDWGGDGSCDKKEIAHDWQIDEPIQICRNCGLKAPTLGLEKTPEEHIEKLVAGFREVRRVLRDDAVLFFNYGDKYNSPGTKCSRHWDGRNKNIYNQDNLSIQKNLTNLAEGNLIGLAWRLALALQGDGWYLRSDIIWCKAWSFHDCGNETKTFVDTGIFGQEIVESIEGQNYSGSTMPESVNGWRWERCRIKVKGSRVYREGQKDKGYADGNCNDRQAEWRDCPGCAKCDPHGGLVLRRGSWRPTRAHEYLFQLAKSPNYFCDMEAVREAVAENTHDRGTKLTPPKEGIVGHKEFCHYCPEKNNPSGRNLRDVWCIGTQAYPDAHYATFPEKLVEPCIKAGTSERGCCPKCGAPWARIVDRPESIQRNDTYQGKHENVDKNYSHKRLQMFTKAGREAGLPHDNPTLASTTLGWLPTCDCEQETVNKQMGGLTKFLEGEASGDAEKKLAVVREMARIQEEFAPVPCIVLDPFMGSGTVAAVAAKLGRNYIGIDINEQYIQEQANKRIAAAVPTVPLFAEAEK